MEKGLVKVYCGIGKGKSQSSLGRALICASEGKSVFVVQFLKGRTSGQLDYLQKLEPDIKFFRFEKERKYFETLTSEEREEEKINIVNGMHFARKVVSIEECDVLVLDEGLGLIDLGISSSEDLIDLIRRKPFSMEMILTGRNLPEELIPYADYISRIDVVRGN